MMLAYHNKSSVKAKYLKRVRAHRKADELIKGTYWQNGKGCAVGCTVHSGNHAMYESELGIPQKLARLEDGIFERLPNSEAMAWPEAFLEAISVGADLSLVADKFLYWLLIDPTDGVIKFSKTQRSKDAISDVAELYKRRLDGSEPPLKEWRDAAAYAYAADDDAYAAAYAAYAYAADDAYAYAAEKARHLATIKQAEKLLELLRQASVPAQGN